MADKYIFKRKDKEYLSLRNYDLVSEYIKQSSMFIHKMKGVSLEEAKQLVLEKIKNKKTQNPMVTFNHRQDNGDVIVDEIPLLDYIKDVKENNELIAPSFTTYYHPSVKESLHSKFIASSVAARSKDKKLAFKYMQEGDTEKYNFYDTMQKTRKIYNNSLSGAYASKSTIICNPSAHYTLTSITRCMSSIGNATTESLVAGNKIFITPESVVNYISTILTNNDMDVVSNILKKYNLKEPSTQEVMNNILESTKWYFNIPNKMKIIEEYISKLTGVERAIVLYTNDLYSIRILNPEFMLKFASELCKQVRGLSTDPINDLYGAAEGVANHTHNLCYTEIKGLSIKYEALAKDNPDLLDLLASTCKHISNTLEEYKDFIQLFFVTNVSPINIAYIPEMLRKSIVLSDTDSTCGSYDEWVSWMEDNWRKQGNTGVYPESQRVAISSAIMTMATQVLDHYIKIFSGNMNLDKSKLDTLKMKNEFYWPAFATMNASKHYYADTMIKEGNVYGFSKTVSVDDETVELPGEEEVKGAALLSSKVAQRYRDMAKLMRFKILNSMNNMEKIDPLEHIKYVADIEREIIEKVKKADLTVLNKDMIKEASAYKSEPTKSNFIHHTLWMDVFKDKYGDPGNPSYNVVIVPTVLNSEKALMEYINNLEDKEIATKLLQFCSKYNKKALGTFRPPIAMTETHGLPVEISGCVDYFRIVTTICNPFYMVLESIGFYRPSKTLICEMGLY